MIPWEIFRRMLFITAFVAVMMIAVEYLNVLTRGAWQGSVLASRWRQYLVAVVLGAVPGCLGAFAVVALYTHRMVSLGALTACMIVTSGDEAFVMLALFPRTAILLTLGIASVGWLAGLATDLAVKPLPSPEAFHPLVLHEAGTCRCFPRGEILRQLRRLRPARGVLAAGLLLFLLAVGAGQAGPPEWNWVRLTLLAAGSFGLFVVLTVPDHFLEEHLWRHTALQHVPRILAWTFGALVVIALLERSVPAETLVKENRWMVLAAAGLFGLLPGSGPHLVFVTFYDGGIVLLSALVASSIVQDGHGMLPLLAHSRRDFLRVKAINLLVGLAVGAALLALDR